VRGAAPIPTPPGAPAQEIMDGRSLDYPAETPRTAGACLAPDGSGYAEVRSTLRANSSSTSN
jgi:hypothetical protein